MITDTQNTPVFLLDETQISRIKKAIRKKFSNVDLTMVKTPVTNKLKLKIRHNFKDLAKVKEACADLNLEFDSVYNGIIEVTGYFEKPEVNKMKVVPSKEEDTILDEIILPEIQDESVETVAVEAVGIEEVSSSNINQILEIPEVASDLLKVFYIPKENVCDCDQVTLRLSFDLTKRADSVKFTELTLFCSLINGDGSAFLVEKNNNFGEVIVDCDKLRIPVSATFRPIRKKALECLLEEQGIFFNPKNGVLQTKPLSDDNNMRMVLNFKLSEMVTLSNLKKKLNQYGFRLSFVNQDAQSILIINYRFVEKNIQYFELLERSEPGYLRKRLVEKFPSNPSKLYFNNYSWYISLKAKDLAGTSYEEYVVKLKEFGYAYIRNSASLLILPSLNPVSPEMLEREMPEAHKNRHPKEEKLAVPVITTILRKEKPVLKEEKLTALARLAKLVQGLTEDESHKLIDKIEGLLKEDSKPKKAEQVHVSLEPVDSARVLRRVIKEMLEKGLIVLDPLQDLSLPYDNVKKRPGGRWKAIIEDVKSMNSAEILKFIQD